MLIRNTIFKSLTGRMPGLSSDAHCQLNNFPQARQLLFDWIEDWIKNDNDPGTADCHMRKRDLISDVCFVNSEF